MMVHLSGARVVKTVNAAGAEQHLVRVLRPLWTSGGGGDLFSWSGNGKQHCLSERWLSVRTVYWTDDDEAALSETEFSSLFASIVDRVSRGRLRRTQEVRWMACRTGDRGGLGEREGKKWTRFEVVLQAARSGCLPERTFELMVDRWGCTVDRTVTTGAVGLDELWGTAAREMTARSVEEALLFTLCEENTWPVSGFRCALAVAQPDGGQQDAGSVQRESVFERMLRSKLSAYLEGYAL
jgi:hypothetical protein